MTEPTRTGLQRPLDLFATLQWVLVAVLVLLLATVLVVVARRLTRGYLERREARLVQRSRPLLLQILAGEGPDEDVVSALTALPEREWRLVETAATTMLGKVTGEARRSLVRILERRGTVERAERRTRARSWVRRSRAAEMLGAAGLAHSTAVLVPLLADRRSEVRRVAARALGRIGSRDAVVPLLDAAVGPRALPARDVASALVLLEPDATPGIVGAVAEARAPQVRSVGAEVLGLRGAVDAAALLVALLEQDDHPEVQIRAARALGRIGVPAATGPLTATLAADAPELRAVAAKALGQIGSEAGVVPLVSCLDDASHRVAANAAEALAATGAHGLAALRALASAPTRPAGYARQALAMHDLGRAQPARVGA